MLPNRIWQAWVFHSECERRTSLYCLYGSAVLLCFFNCFSIRVIRLPLVRIASFAPVPKSPLTTNLYSAGMGIVLRMQLANSLMTSSANCAGPTFCIFLHWKYVNDESFLIATMSRP